MKLVSRKKISFKSVLKKIKSVFKKYFSTNILFVTYILCSLIIGIMVRAFTVSDFSIKPFIVDLVVLLIFGSLGYLFKPHNQFKYFFTMLIISAFLGFANTLYYEFYKSFLSVNLISTASMLSAVEASVIDKIKFNQITFVIVPIIFFCINNFLKKKKYYFEVEKTEKKKNMVLGTLFVGLIGLLIIIITLSKTEGSRFIKQWNREYIVQRFGIYSYTINDFVQSISPQINSWFGYDEAALKFRKYYSKTEQKNSGNLYTNIYENKNILFIHAESIQNFLIGLKINGQEVTPNLNKLSSNNMYFSSFYPQIGVGTSSDTEFTLLTGLMPASTGTVFVSYSDRTFESLPKIFADKGYYTFSMHANNADYWNRKTMHKNLGYKDFYAKESYIIDDYIGLGLSDKSFFNQLTPILKEIKTSSQKFMGTIITLTNHSPFNEIERYGEFDVSMPYVYTNENGENEELVAPYLEGTEIGNYIKSSHYADQALGLLFENLESQGILENTVVVIYGDHEARLGKNQLNLLYNYDPFTNDIKSEEDPTYINFDNYVYDLYRNTPLIIYNKDNPISLEVTNVMGMYDVLPTIANMFNLEYNYALGNDIFSNNEKIVIFPNGNFLTDKVYYNNLKDDYISLTTLPINSDYIERLKKYAEERLEVSDAIIQYDLIKNEGDKIEK